MTKWGSLPALDLMKRGKRNKDKFKRDIINNYSKYCLFNNSCSNVETCREKNRGDHLR